MALLTETGLPKRVRMGEEDLLLSLSFAPLERGLVPFAETLPDGVAPAPAWREHLVLGEERLEGGASPTWCLQRKSGHVEAIDLESDGDEPQLVNSSVEHLLTTLRALAAWARGAASERTVEALQTALEAADPEAWASGFWNMLAEQFASQDTIACVFDP